MTQRSKEKKLEPEYRLMAMISKQALGYNTDMRHLLMLYPMNLVSTPFMLAGLILLGFALEDVYHYMIAALGW